MILEWAAGYGAIASGSWCTSGYLSRGIRRLGVACGLAACGITAYTCLSVLRLLRTD